MNGDKQLKQIHTIKLWLGTGSINLFGLPFAGKDTQAKSLATLLGANVLGSGDIFRNSPVPNRVKIIMDAGQLIPTKDFISIFLPYLSKPELADQPIILSSVGKWHGEEKGVIAAAAAANHPIKAVVHLNVQEEIVWQRWEEDQMSQERGPRIDDALEKIDTRLHEFRSKTVSVIEYYRLKGLLVEVDGSLDSETITHKILEQLYKRALRNT